MRATFDATGFDAADEVPGASDPFVTEADVVGLYRPDIAAAASRSSTTLIGTENQTDD